LPDEGHGVSETVASFNVTQWLVVMRDEFVAD